MTYGRSSIRPDRALRAALVTISILLGLVLVCPSRALADAKEPKLAEAKSAVVLDAGGNVLYEKNAYEQRDPASTTKIMTAMVVLDAVDDLGEQVTMVEDDLGYLALMADYGTGDKVSVRELLQVMLVFSANDAAHNLALYVSGSEEAFSELMNNKAAELGMEHTHFVNPHGMGDDGHYSCAYDLALMGKSALEGYPLIAQSVVMRSVQAHLRGVTVQFDSSDDFIKTYPGARGVKSGALIGDYTFVGAAERDGVQLYTGVMGCATIAGRFTDTASLMDWAFARFKGQNLADDSMVVGLRPSAVDFSRKAVVSVVSDFSATVWPQGEGLSFRSVMTRANGLVDPSTAYGWTTWSQGKRRFSQDVRYETRPSTTTTSSWPVFTLPLFADTDSLGNEVIDVH